MWLTTYVKYWLLKFFVNVIRCGPIPRHISFILDGNRRFSKQRDLKIITGHTKGIDKLDQMIETSRVLGITEISAYGFSTENLNRTPKEVEDLLQVFEYAQIKFVLNNPRMSSYGMREIVVGDMTLMPAHLRKLFAQGMLETATHSNIILNIVIYYTSKHELTNTIKILTEAVHSGLLKVEDIDEHLINNCLYTKLGVPVDLYIRTSGESRFSDFLMWQSGFAQVAFLEPCWPELSFWDILSTVLSYQHNYEPLKQVTDTLATKTTTNPRVRNFLETVKQQELIQLQNYLSEESVN